MTNVGMIIPTPSGLRTVVQVLPGHVNPSLTQAVTLPVGDAGDSFPPPEYFGTPLPGQAQSAATFVQTLIMPSDGGSSDSSSATSTSSDSATASAATAASNSSTSSTTVSSSNDSLAASQSTDQSSTANASASSSAQSTANNASSSAYAQAVGAYQTAQQRGDGASAQHPRLIG